MSNPRVREDAFSAVTEESAYWVGFLMADGCVLHNRNVWYVSLCLSEKDRDHVERFREFLRYYRPVRSAGKGTCRLKVGNRRLVENLASFGVVRNKTHTATVRRLAGDRHFWRGVIDGDGCLGVYEGRPRLHLVGSQSLLRQFLEWVESLGEAVGVGVNRCAGVYQVNLSGEQAIRVASTVYADCCVSLSRKQRIADSWTRSGFTRKNLDWSAVTTEEMERAHAELGTWARVAERMGVTLLKIA